MSDQPFDQNADQPPADLPAQPAPAEADARDARIAELEAQLAAAEAATAAPAKPADKAPTTVALSPADESEDYSPAVGDIVDYKATDPQNGSELTGTGLVVETAEGHSVVAQLNVLQLPVTTLAKRS